MLDHASENRKLNVFYDVGIPDQAEGRYHHLGSFDLEAQQHFTEIDDSSRFLVHLVPQDSIIAAGHFLAASTCQAFEQGLVVTGVPLETHLLTSFTIPGTASGIAEKIELKLVLAYKEYLESRGHDLMRLKIVTQGAVRPLFTDLYDRNEKMVYEVKASTTREILRLGLGQILDYRRYLSADVRAALLLPNEPQREMLELFDAHSVSTIWLTPSSGFRKFSKGAYCDL